MTSSNSQNFIENLNNIASGYFPIFNNNPAVDAGFDSLPNQFVFGTTNPVGFGVLNTHLIPSLFNRTNTTDAISFINNYYIHVLGYPSISDIPPEAYDPENPGGLLNGYFKIYKFLMGFEDASGNSDLSLINTTNLAAQFNALFTDYLRNGGGLSLLSSSPTIIPQKFGGISFNLAVNNNYNNFFGGLINYLRTTTVVQNESASLFFDTNLFSRPNSSVVSDYVQSFKTIYESFNGPVGTLSTNSASWTVAQKVFVERLNAFYNAELQKNATPENPTGFFDTSHSLGNWYNFSQNLYYNPSFNPSAIIVDPRSTIILDDVLKLLISMIGTIQNVAAAQANSLNFLSQWQQSYTNKLNQIHTFAQGDGTVIGSFNLGNANWDQNGAQAVRNQLNNINQSFISKVQANQQTISDQAKALQSNVNQSNDAANQQGSIADSILQTMSTILSSIFR